MIQVKAFRPDFYSTDFQHRNVGDGKDGLYSLEMESYGQKGNRYRVRIEADGYRTALGKKDMAVGDPPLEEDFQLEPKPARVGVVEAPDGGAVSEFKVAVGTPTTSPPFSLDHLEDDFGIAFEVHGSDRFQLAASFEPSRIRVFNDQGFAEVLRQPDEPIGTIRLQPWSSISGRLMQGDVPIANEGVHFWPVIERGLTEARFQDSFYTETDSEGNFRFDKLPPELGRVGAYLGPWEDSVLTSSESMPIHLEPGKTYEVNLGGGGTEVAGRVTATGRSNDQMSKKWSLNYLIRRDQGTDRSSEIGQLSFAPSGPFDTAWTKQPDFHQWLSSHQYHFVELSEDGRFAIHGVEPGNYELLIQLYEQPTGCLVETVGQKLVPVVISETKASEKRLELGDIEVPCRVGPRADSDMRAFPFTDGDGVVRSVDDMHGRYVLLHVWASWCRPCVESMPSLRATLDEYSDKPLTVVGLNIDADRQAALAMAKSQKLAWAQNYLGEESAAIRQLAASSVPAYYLIGPDGKLVGSSGDWGQVRLLLQERLKD